MTDLDPEDAKLITLARAARTRVAATSGAAVRDTTGRTYASAEVTLGAVHLSAVVLAVANAVAAGASGLEAVVLDGDGPSETDLAAIVAVAGHGVPVLVVDVSGQVVRTVPA